MSDPVSSAAPGRGFWIIGVLALAWNLIGVASYLMTVTASPEALAALPEAERALYEGTPKWVTSAYAIAVFGGALGSVALLMRKGWAVPVFLISLIAIVLQMGHAFFGSALLEVKGAGGAMLPLLIVLIAIYLLWYSSTAKK
jgi:hypothetical protein